MSEETKIDLKNLLTIKIRRRDDNFSDQYNRMFMMKVMLVCSAICGISWYGDKFNCIVPESMSTFEEFPKFVSSTCWIQGVYVYRELRTRADDVAYYGIPVDADLDGTVPEIGDLCKTVDRLTHEKNDGCTPLQKTFFQQYQYMPFLIAALGLMFYIPRMIHKVANNDIIKLEQLIKKEKPDIDVIFKTYFTKRERKPRNKGRLTSRHLVILLVKVCYVGVNIVSLLTLDSIFNGVYIGFGGKWLEWAKQNNTMKHDYMGSREFPRPANELLPPFGYCELYSSAKDIKETHVNKHKMVCELSQHVLYQYVLMLLWILLIVGIIVSAIGLVLFISKLLVGLFGLRSLGENPSTKNVFQRLTHREIDYLEFLKSQNVLVYGEIKAKLISNTGIPNGITEDVETTKSLDETSLLNRKIEQAPMPTYYNNK